MLMSCLAARSQRRSVMFFVDMDYRQHSWQLYRAGHWTLRSYLLNRFLYDPMLTLQLRLAPKLFDVCCFKSESLVRDFGGGRHNVRSFFDTVHSAADVVNGTARETRVAWLRQTTTSFKVVYFGRLVFNKGIDKMIAAVDMARARGVDVCMRIIGSGDRLDSLVEQIQVLGLARHVQLFDAVQYGEKLFSLLEDCHVSLAAPLIEDTPRSAFDSFSRGLPIVAFDTGYFTDLAQKSGAVLTSPWSSVEGLAEAMVKLARNRELLCQMCENAIKFATDNTQEIWLRRRMDWLTEVTPELRTALSAPQ
jgi:glycosyltransferase involved in cell wall biosynthesis